MFRVQSVFQARKIVINYPPQNRPLLRYCSGCDSHMLWANALMHSSMESVAIFGRQGELLGYNNRFGTLDNSDDVHDIQTYFTCLSRRYTNATHCLSELIRIYSTKTPRLFTLFMVDGSEVLCRITPVVDNQGIVMGVTMVASRCGDGGTAVISISGDDSER